ncbi:MAG: hypothetical protein ACI4WS_11615 [Oscillospiraceae bacterium]
MLITAEEYKQMGFPEVSVENLDSCIIRSDYIIGALTEGRAAKAVAAGGQPAQFVKQAAGFQTYMLLKETETIEKSQTSGAEKVSIGDYSYSTQSSESSEVQTAASENTGVNVIRLLRAAGCLYAGVEVAE